MYHTVTHGVINVKRDYDCPTVELTGFDPLTCPKCTGEMRIISFIYKKSMIKKILTHLNIFEEKKNERAPPRSVPEYTETPEIVPYDDGWPGYDESVFDF